MARVREVVRTEWIRSTPVNKSTQINGAIDAKNIVKGTRKRKDYNYADTLFNSRVNKPTKLSKLRASQNNLEKRLKKAAQYSKNL
jgi:hypothetical protein